MQIRGVENDWSMNRCVTNVSWKALDEFESMQSPLLESPRTVGRIARVPAWFISLENPGPSLMFWA